MIKFIKGKFHPYSIGSVIVETVSGMGFEVFVPSNSQVYRTLEGEDVKLHTEMVVKEDGITLYGFSDVESLDVFRMLITVNGVGPKAAMSIMSTLSTDQLVLAIAGGDAKSIATSPGVGKKTSERLILELKDKIGKFAEANGIMEGDGVVSNDVQAGTGFSADDDFSQALEALISLGYNRSEAIGALEKVKNNASTTEEYIRKALGQLF